MRLGATRGAVLYSTSMMDDAPYRRQWLDYRTAGGARPIKRFLMSLTLAERAEIVAAMKEVSRDGGHERQVLSRAVCGEGQHNHVLLSLEAFA